MVKGARARGVLLLGAAGPLGAPSETSSVAGLQSTSMLRPHSHVLSPSLSGSSGWLSDPGAEDRRQGYRDIPRDRFIEKSFVQSAQVPDGGER
jgi:hypothetical protein